MTAVITAPSAQNISFEKIVSINVGVILQARGLQKKDLAAAMGVAPQVIARHLRGKATWSIDDVCNAARFLNVSLETLLKPTLTAEEILGYEKTAAPDDSRNGGQLVAGHGFEPWTSGL